MNKSKNFSGQPIISQVLKILYVFYIPKALFFEGDENKTDMCQIEHSRHRSFGNFMTNILSGLIAYSFFPKKPAI